MEQCSVDVQSTALLGELLAYSTSILARVPQEQRPEVGVEMNTRLAGLLAAQGPGTYLYISLLSSKIISSIGQPVDADLLLIYPCKAALEQR